MWGRFVGKIKEFFLKLKLMQRAGKIKLILLGSYGLVALVVVGMLLGYLSLSYILLSIAAVIVYLVLVLLETLYE